MRDQHAQRRCDHHGAGEGRHSHCPNNFSSADCQNGQRQSRRARKRNCTSGGRCECLAGRREETTAAVGGKGPGNPIEGQRVMRLFRIDFSDTGVKRMAARGSVTHFEQSVRNLGVVGLLSLLEGRGLIYFPIFGTTPAVTGAGRRIAGWQISVKTHC